MNERIRECWLKAAREDSNEKWDTQVEFIERFAELIVQECADVASGLAMPTVALRIKEHFGVKE